MGRGQLLQQTLGRCQGHWNGMGLVARICQHCPSPALPGSPQLSLLRVEAGDEQLPMAALLALGSSRATAPNGQQPPAMASGTACSTALLQGFLPFPRQGTQDTESRGTLCSFLPCRVCGENRRERRLRSTAALPSIPSQGGQVSGASRGECTAQHQAGGSCLPTASTFAGTRDQGRSPCQPGPAWHYTYCFLEAELPGRLPGFSSGAEASAGWGA